MSSTYSQKEIRITVTLDEGGSPVQKVFEGFACTAEIDKPGAPELPKARISLRGLSLDTMTALTQLGFEPLAKRKNYVEISAGEKGLNLSSVFKGEITSAWADFNSAPSIEFRIEAKSGSYPKLIPQSPISVKGQQKASEAIKSLCDQIGYSFENNGVTASISNCVIRGDPIEKMRWIANTVGANLIIDDSSVVLLPKKGVRKTTGEIPSISAENGLIGYPTFDDKGVSFECFFAPDLKIGATVHLDSIVPHATGNWKIVSLGHGLSANDPGGSQGWKTAVKAQYLRQDKSTQTKTIKKK